MCIRDSVHDGHLDVHADHVGRKLSRQLHRFLAVRGLADDLEVGLSLENHSKARANERLIVDQQYSDHALISFVVCTHAVEGLSLIHI